MQMHDIEMLILVKNRPIVEYEHQDQTFIEGRSGSNYEIELRNNNHFRVEAILSVDGLSVIDGKEAGPNSRSYMIPARGTLRIPGWLLDSGSAAKFAFAGKQDSYAAKSGGSGQNVGVIGALVYREKPAPAVPLANWPPNYPYNWINNTGTPNLHGYAQTSSVPSGTININTTTTNDLLMGSSAPFIGASFSSIAGVSSNNNASVYQTATTTPLGNAAFRQGLGTTFGDATEFATKTVAFERGDQLAIMTLFYDNMRGLRARGVPIERKPKVFSQPNAFPGLAGCTPPPGWSASASASKT